MKYFRFSLVTLLAVIGLLALPLGYLSQAGFLPDRAIASFQFETFGAQ